MTRRIRMHVAGAAIALLISVLAGGALHAAQISFVSVSGNWHDARDNQPGSQTGDPAITNGVPTSSIQWGVGNQQSGYDFTRSIPGAQTLPPAPTPYFPMGTFTHRNFPITGPTLTSVDLDVVLQLTVDGVPTGPMSFTFKFTHVETSNNADPCPFPTPENEGCTDQVTFISSPQPTTFNVGGVDYTLSMSFVDGNGQPVARFLTRENLANVANLVGQFTLPPPPLSSTIQFSPLEYTVNENGGAAALTVTRTGDATQPASALYWMENGTAQSPADFTAASGVVNFSAGDTAPKTILVPIVDDTLIEGEENFRVFLGGVVGAVLGASTATVRILDNDELPPTPAPVITFTATPTTILKGETSLLQWSITNATSAVISTVGAVNPAAGTQSVTPVATATYVLTAWGPGGQSVAQVTVVVNAPPTVPSPVISFSANPSGITPGDSSLLSWTITNATSAVINQGIGAISASAGSRTVTPAATTTYTLTAWGEGGQSTAQVTVTVSGTPPPPPPPAPVINFTASPLLIEEGQSSTLQWTITNATSAIISPLVGPVSAASGNQPVTPAATQTYTLTAWGLGGVASAQVTVTVVPPPPPPPPPAPSINFTASPTLVLPGDPSTLDWTIQNATSAVILPGIGAIAATAGSTVVNPTATTMYTLTAWGDGGRADAQVTVNVAVVPVPHLTELVPQWAPTGFNLDFPLTVKGRNFVPNSVVLWGSTALQTQYLDSSRLTATITPDFVVSAGVFTIRVENPLRDGGMSDNGLPFGVENRSFNCNQPPVIEDGYPSVSANPVTGKTATLSVAAQSTCPGSDAFVSYSWTVVSGAANQVTLPSANGSPEAKTITATFKAPGAYRFRVRARDVVSGLYDEGDVDVEVVRTPGRLVVSPKTVQKQPGEQFDFSATVYDQWDAVMNLEVRWSASVAGVMSPTSGSGRVPEGVPTIRVTAELAANPSVNDFGDVQIMGVGPHGGRLDLNLAKAFPVPYKATTSARDYITFAELAEGSVIHIYTVDGREIKRLDSPTGDDAYWYLDNHGGDKVSSGVYLYSIKAGEHKKEGKLVIIR